MKYSEREKLLIEAIEDAEILNEGMGLDKVMKMLGTLVRIPLAPIINMARLLFGKNGDHRGMSNEDLTKFLNGKGGQGFGANVAKQANLNREFIFRVYYPVGKPVRDEQTGFLLFEDWNHLPLMFVVPKKAVQGFNTESKTFEDMELLNIQYARTAVYLGSPDVGDASDASVQRTLTPQQAFANGKLQTEFNKAVNGWKELRTAFKHNLEVMNTEAFQNLQKAYGSRVSGGSETAESAYNTMNAGKFFGNPSFTAWFFGTTAQIQKSAKAGSAEFNARLDEFEDWLFKGIKLSTARYRFLSDPRNTPEPVQQPQEQPQANSQGQQQNNSTQQSTSQGQQAQRPQTNTQRQATTQRQPEPAMAESYFLFGSMLEESPTTDNVDLSTDSGLDAKREQAREKGQGNPSEATANALKPAYDILKFMCVSFVFEPVYEKIGVPDSELNKVRTTQMSFPKNYALLNKKVPFGLFCNPLCGGSVFTTRNLADVNEERTSQLIADRGTNNESNSDITWTKGARYTIKSTIGDRNYSKNNLRYEGEVDLNGKQVHAFTQPIGTKKMYSDNLPSAGQDWSYWIEGQNSTKTTIPVRKVIRANPDAEHFNPEEGKTYNLEFKLDSAKVVSVKAKFDGGKFVSIGEGDEFNFVLPDGLSIGDYVDIFETMESTSPIMIDNTAMSSVQLTKAEMVDDNAEEGSDQNQEGESSTQDEQNQEVTETIKPIDLKQGETYTLSAEGVDPLTISVDAVSGDMADVSFGDSGDTIDISGDTININGVEYTSIKKAETQDQPEEDPEAEDQPEESKIFESPIQINAEVSKKILDQSPIREIPVGLITDELRDSLNVPEMRYMPLVKAIEQKLAGDEFDTDKRELGFRVLIELYLLGLYANFMKVGSDSSFRGWLKSEFQTDPVDDDVKWLIEKLGLDIPKETLEKIKSGWEKNRSIVDANGAITTIDVEREGVTIKQSKEELQVESYSWLNNF